MNFIALLQWFWGCQVLLCFYFTAWKEFGMGLFIVTVLTIIRVRTEKEEVK